MAEDESKDDLEVYDSEGIEELGRNDEVTPEEEGFMKGYDGDIVEKKPDSEEEDEDQA